MKCLFRAAMVSYLFSVLLFSGPLAAAAQNPSKPQARTIEVKMIESEEITLPAEFQVALYENLIQQLEKRGGFDRVYRDGDRNATALSDRVILHSTVRGFKQGSERKRQVTTVTGATSITVHCQFTDAKGDSLLERDIQGKVRFFGGNLKATYDFAKKTTKLARELTVARTEKASSQNVFLFRPSTSHASPVWYLACAWITAWMEEGY